VGYGIREQYKIPVEEARQSHLTLPLIFGNQAVVISFGDPKNFGFQIVAPDSRYHYFKVKEKDHDM
jgi:hypothetical protein